MEYVVMVDDHDRATGFMEKQQAHIDGVLHRAISVFIFNTKGEMLLQKRAEGKYHSSGLWTNACCSHPRPDENPADAAVRRLHEEMGIKCVLRHAFSFIYNAQLDSGLTEHEYDHVFVGITDATPLPSAEEVAEWEYINPAALTTHMASHPEQYTEWFKICMEQYRDKLIKQDK